MRMDSRWGRVARGWAAASFATITAAVSHGLAGGIPPSFFGLAASLVLSVAVCTVLAGRTLSWGRLAAAIAASQFLFHGLFSTFGAPTVVDHAHGASAGVMDATATHAHGTMWLAHAAAGLITLVAYRYGEAAFWGLASVVLVATRLVAEPVPVIASEPPRLTPAVEVLPSFAFVLLSSMRHRGPPLAAGTR